MKIVAIDAAYAGIAWVKYDGHRILAKGWRAFPAEGRTLKAVRDWLDASLLPHCGDVTKIFIESTNLFGAPDDADGKPQNFMLQYQLSVRECAQTVAMYCVMMDIGEGDPEMVMPQSWRASFKAFILKPRPKGAAEWKAWSQKVCQQLLPGCLDGLGKKAKEDTADASLLAVHGWGSLQPSAKKVRGK